MEKGSLFLWVCLGVVGILSIFAMAFAGYTYTQTQQGGSINVRSINLGTRTITESGTTGSAASGTVVATGTYDIQFQYIVPGVPTPQTSTTAGIGTYTYKYVTDSTGAFNTYILEISTMSYTFTAHPSVTYVRALLTNFAPIPNIVQGVTYMCKPYVVRQNNGASDVTLNSVTSGYIDNFSFTVFPSLGPTITSGYVVSILQPIKVVTGEIAI